MILYKMKIRLIYKKVKIWIYLWYDLVYLMNNDATKIYRSSSHKFNFCTTANS